MPKNGTNVLLLWDDKSSELGTPCSSKERCKKPPEEGGILQRTCEQVQQYPKCCMLYYNRMMKLKEMEVQIGTQNQWKRVSGFM
jgi:hypothetical protein